MAARKKPGRRGSARAAGRATTRRAAAAEAEPERTAADEPSHNEFELNNDEIETALQTGEHAGLLEDYFGRESYLELRRLAREAASRRVRGGPPVWILPGLMGTKLGRQRAIRVFDDVYWFDPIDIRLGKLSRLALPGGAQIETLGVMLIAYLRLKLHLQRAGYDAQFHEFDWRLGIDRLGNALKAKLAAREGQDVNLVAHSMGGVVARWALQNGAACRRLVTLGTPNFGSFAPVQALRGTYPVVRKVALLAGQPAEELARNIFSTFPGLTQLLPFRQRWSDVDLFDLGTWPAGADGTDDGLHPREKLLAEAAKVQQQLDDGRGGLPRDTVFVIVGVDQATTVGLRRDGGDFVYEQSTAGDGTVPLDFARLPEAAKHYHVAESHGSLPNNGVVARAVIDLLDRGATDALPDTYPADRRGVVMTVRDADLRVDPYPDRRGGRLSQREMRHALEEVASPVARDDVPPSAVLPAAAMPPTVAAPTAPVDVGYRHQFDRVVVGRRRQHRIDIRFALGDITGADSRAIALGVYRDVAPSGPAVAVDARLGGAITEMARRRMFSAGVGEVFILPTGRHPMAADLITFVGLGSFDRFNEQVLQTAAENVLRTFVNTRVEEFATVLFGAGSGENPASALQNLLAGFFSGLRDADRDHRFRRIVVCERDPRRYVQLKEELYRLSSTALCHDVEITFDEMTLPRPLEAPEAPRRARREDPIYLIVRQEGGEGDGDTPYDVRSSVLTAGAKATVVTGVRQVKRGDFERLRKRIVDGRKSFDDDGLKLGTMLLADEVRAVLPSQRNRHLVVVHDGPTSRVPWETLALPGGQGPDGGGPWFPSAERGMSRRYAADNLSVAKWLEERVEDGVLNVLLVVNPTGDLAGAEAEGHRVQALFRGLPSTKLDELWGKDATRPALLSRFSSGTYDMIHYAGHAFFDEASPERSGILCHNHVPISGVDLAQLTSLPTLVFFNACESGRLRRSARGLLVADDTSARKPRLEHARDAVGLAEAFLRGGVSVFVGTYWPVGDAAAKAFADAFYSTILRGETVGDAVLAGRTSVKDDGSRDWADYILYGSQDFVIKELGSPAAGATS